MRDGACSVTLGADFPEVFLDRFSSEFTCNLLHGLQSLRERSNLARLLRTSGGHRGSEAPNCS
jgi:hypothetical protein